MRRDKEGRSCDADISLFSCPASIRWCPSFLAKRRSAVRKIMAAITLHSCEERASERAKRLYAGNGAVAVSVFMCTVLQFCFSAFLSLSLSLSPSISMSEPRHSEQGRNPLPANARLFGARPILQCKECLKIYGYSEDYLFYQMQRRWMDR